jgi:DNA-binding MarR family transcriptional regulator
MNGDLKRNLLRSIFCFKKANISISRSMLNADGIGLSVTELSALNCIGNCDEKDCGTADQTAHHAMHETLAVSKAAVSQMLGSLEKRGYIRREIDLDNRRKIIITVTEKGKTAVDRGKKQMDALTSRIIGRFGEKDTRDFVQLVTRFSEIVYEETGKSD